MKFFLMMIALTISQVSLGDGMVRISALNGKVSILAPEGFGPMPADMLVIKYPNSRRPTEVLSNNTGSVTLAFNHTQNAMRQNQIKEAHPSISQMIHSAYPSAEWIRDEVVEQNGASFIVMELITPAIDTRIHNIIYGAAVDNRLLLAAFNTTVEQSESWLPAGRAIMSSLKVQ